jgi:hypothetical protein
MADQKQSAEGGFSHTSPGARAFVEGDGRPTEKRAKLVSKPLSAEDQIELAAEHEAQKPRSH